MGVPLNVQGVVSGVVIAAAVLARPLIAAFVDTFPSRRKAIFLVLICLMIASYNPLGYLPPLQPPPRLSGSLLPPPHGLNTPLLVVPPNHHHQRYRQDECVVTSAWDCFAFPLSSTQEEEEESLSGTPDTELRFSLRLFEEGRHKEFEEGENSHEEGNSGSSKSEKYEEEKNKLGYSKNNFGGETRLGEGGNELEGENKLGEFENKLRDDENKFEEDQNSHTGDHKGTVLHEEVREQVMAVRRWWGLDSNETLVYVVEGSSEWRFTNVYNVSVRCLGGELGTLDADGAAQEGSCEPAILKEGGFWVYVLCLLASYITATTVESISDAICCDSIGEGGDYGRQRVWGVLSYGMLGALSGVLVDWRSGECTVRDYRAAFLLMTACGTLDFLLSAACLKVPKLELQRKGVWTNLSSLLRRLHFAVFLVTALLTGFFDGLDTGFLFVLQEDIAEGRGTGSKYLNAAQGFTLLVQAIAAIPFMFVGDSLVRRFSAERVMNAVLFLYSIRLLSLSAASYFGVLWCTVVVEVINGPCFGLGYTAIVIHAAALAPRGLSTTVQSVVGVCYGTLGYAGASFVGGIVYELVGSQRLYLLTGMAALCTWTLHLAHLKLCPPNIKATKFKMAEGEQQEEPEVLQVTVGRDGDTTEATRRGGTEGELLKKEKKVVERGEGEETIEKGKEEEETDGKGKDKKEIAENGKERKKEEEEAVKKENETEDEVVDKQMLIMDKKTSEKADEEEKTEEDEETETNTLLKKNAVPIRGKERDDIVGGGGGGS